MDHAANGFWLARLVFGFSSSTAVQYGGLHGKLRYAWGIHAAEDSTDQ